MKFVYLAHPFISNPKGNIQRINKIAEKIIEKQMKELGTLEHIPFVPHNILSVFLEVNNPDIRPVTEEVSQRMVNFCDQLWICSPSISSGMTMEINVAKRKEIPIIPYEEVTKRFEITKF